MKTAKSKKKNLVIYELEPLNPGRKRSLGEVRRELRVHHRRRVDRARELGIPTDVIDRLTAAELDALIRDPGLTHTPTEVPDRDESAS